MFAGSGLIVVGLLAGGTIVQGSTGAPTVAPRATTTHTATFTTTPSSAWDLDNCLQGEVAYETGPPVFDDDGPVLDENGNQVFEQGGPVLDDDGNQVFLECYEYGVKDDDYSAPLRAGSFTVRTTLTRLPAGWGLCSADSPAYQGWLWSLNRGQVGSFQESFYVHSETAQYLVPESGTSWSDQGNVLTRTFTVTTPSWTNAKNIPVLNALVVPLCGPDPSTVSGQGWRNFTVPEYRLPAISRWK